MAKVQLKRRNTGGALVPGTAPLTFGVGGLKSGEPVWDGVADILYIGKGDDGAGNSTSIASIAGAGAFLRSSLVNAANGVAGLDAGGKIAAAQLPASIVGAMVYQGVWDASTNTPALASGTGTKGFFYKVSVAGTTALDGNASWDVGDMVTFDGTTWDKIDGPVETVRSVAGRIGVITLAVADLTDSGATGRALVQAATPAIAKTALALAVGDVTGAAPLAAPAFTGVPTAPTAAPGTNNTQIATTAYTDVALAAKANIASPTFTGVPAGPTAAANTNTTQLATTAFVLAQDAALNVDGGVI